MPARAQPQLTLCSDRLWLCLCIAGGVSAATCHTTTDAESTGQKGHIAARSPQQEEADRAAAAAHVAEVAKYKRVPIGGANILLVDVYLNGHLGGASNLVAPLLGAAIRVGFVVSAFGTAQQPNTCTWTLQRSGGELSPTLQHQLRKAIGLARAAYPSPMHLVINCN